MVAFTRFFTALFLLPVIKTLAFPTSGNDTTITTIAISLAERSEDLEPVSYDDVPSTEELVLPTFRCMGTWNFMYNHYLVWGKDWHKTEGEIKRAVKSTPRCLVTIYKYRGSRTAEPEQPDEDGLKWDFKLSFHMPVGCQNRLSKTMNKLLNIHPDKKQGIEGFAC